jgi:SAM-dependent methyltransferase
MTHEPAGRAARGQVNTEAAQVYEDFFVPALFGQWVDRMLDAVGLEPGESILDVGCGTGIVARRAIERAGGDGIVVGVDPNPGMLAVAQRAEPAVEWRGGTAETLPCDDHEFDRLVCQFAAMFFADPGRAVDEMGRVVRPGGTIAIATWSSVDESPGYAAMVGLLRRVVGGDAADALLAPFAMGEPAALIDLVRPACPDVTVVRHDGVAQFDSIDGWLHTDIRGWTLSDMVDDETFETLRIEAHRELARFTDDLGHVRFAAPALIATATTPTDAA